MSDANQENYIDELFNLPVYGVPAKEKKARFLAAMNQAYKLHFANCPAYARYCSRRGFNESTEFESIDQIPYLPVHAFKAHWNLLSSVPDSKVLTRLQSSATSGVPSTVVVDQTTSKRQIKALAQVLAWRLGGRRRPFFIIDVDPTSGNARFAGARAAAIKGFLNLASNSQYFMGINSENRLQLLESEFSDQVSAAAENGQPVIVFGFTFVLYEHVIQNLLNKNFRLRLPEGSIVAHIGGWKKLEDQKVDRGRFNAECSQLFGIPESHVVDFYGFTEQMGVTYPDMPSGAKVTPIFSEIIVRDPETHRVLGPGEVGLLEFLTPLPNSYPGIAVLTDDIGMILPIDGDSQQLGTMFSVLGRAKNAEIRGCGEIMGEKMVRRRLSASPSLQTTDESSMSLLFDESACYVPKQLNASIDRTSLPKVENVADLANRLRTNREVLDQYSIDEIATLIGAASELWLSQDSELALLRQQGLLFLRNWCRPASLRRMADESLRGRRGYIDSFKSVQGINRRLLGCRPRGLAVHWLAGNVPLLGMLALVQSILTKNANILKAPSSFSNVIPLLLNSFRDLTVESSGGSILKGNDLLSTIAVVYYSSTNKKAAEEISAVADTRIVWGGSEAVEAITDLPKRYSTEDIIYGPKLSYMVIGKEFLNHIDDAKRIARRASVDAAVFDQYACASPHTIFVESGGSQVSPKEFAKLLAEEMAKVAIRIPKGPTDAGTATQVAMRRLEYEFTGDLWTSLGTEWSVLYDEKGANGLADPCYSRVITVRAIDNVLAAAEFAHSGIQTIGIGLEGSRKLEFTSRASQKGADRFPDIGRMTLFDSPWDGMFAMDRLVRWVTVGGPF